MPTTRATPRFSTRSIWSPHWYSAVLRTTGFEPYRPRQIHLTGAAREAADRTRPHYNRPHDAGLRL